MDPAMALQYTKHGPLYIGSIFAFYATKMRSKDSGAQRDPLIGSRTRLGPLMDLAMALYIIATFLHSMQQKWDQGTLGTQSSTLIGSRTRLGPSMDPALPFNTPNMALY